MIDFRQFLQAFISLVFILFTTGYYQIVLAEQPTVPPGALAFQSPSHIWPQPSYYLNGLPVYEKFETFEPILRFDNDTTYIVNFWATWCKPCIEELPYFEQLTSEYRNEKIKVILCSLDFPRQLESQLLPFLKKRQLSSTVVVLLDGKFNNWIDKVSAEWSGTLPATYIYRGDKYYFTEQPVKSKDELEDLIRSL